MKITFAPGFEKSFNKCFSRNLIYAIPRFFNDKYYSIKYAYQRVSRGYDDRTIFDHNDNVATIIIDSLTLLKKDPMGHPCNIKGVKEWQKILRTIIQGFKAYHKLTDLAYIRKTNKVYKTGKKKGHAIYNIDRRAEKKWHKDFNTGMKLYHKHFFALWD